MITRPTYIYAYSFNRKSKMILLKKRLFTGIFLILICHLTTTALASTQALDQKNLEQLVDGNEEDSRLEEYLNTLSIKELEEICTSRGFQLQPEDGFAKDEYTHEDYIDAAMQCLAIEAEIEAAIEENPELLDQLKNEAQRMQTEKEELEAELLRLLKEKSDEERKEKEDDGSHSHHAFISDSQLEKEVVTDNSDFEEISNREEINSDDDDDETAPIDTTTEAIPGVIEETDDSSTSDIDMTDSVSVPSTSQPSSIVTLNEFFTEFRNQVMNDMNKVMVVIEPITTPLVKVMRATLMSVYLSISDMVKRYSESIISNVPRGNDGKPETCSSNQSDATKSSEIAD